MVKIRFSRLQRNIIHFVMIIAIIIAGACSSQKERTKIPKDKEKYAEEKKEEQRKKEQKDIEKLKERHMDNQDKKTRRRMKRKKREMERRRKGKHPQPFWRRWFSK